MLEELAPSTVARPAANYALAMRVSDVAVWVHTAGIVGTRPDGTIAADIGEQAAEVWRTVGALLAEAGMGPRDIVSYTTYAVVGLDLGEVMAARDAFLGDHRAASVLIPVPALAQPAWKVEIAVVAARA
jgi:2-iminobutanoate/2-iminopropanoate deaminase